MIGHLPLLFDLEVMAFVQYLLLNFKELMLGTFKVIVKANLVCNIKDLRHLLVTHITYDIFSFLVQNCTLFRGHLEAMKEAKVRFFLKIFLVYLSFYHVCNLNTAC